MAFDFKKFYSELEGGPSMTPSMAYNLKQMHLPSESDRPDLFGDFSRIPLGREQAQNTAQRGEATSNYMQDAYKAVMDAPQGFPGITGQQVPFEQQIKDLSKQLESQYKEKGNYITASGAIAKSPTPVEGMAGYQLGLKEHPRGFETMAKEIVEGMQDVMKGLPSRHAIEFMGGSHGGAGAGFQGMPAQTSSSNVVPYEKLGQYAPREATPLEKQQREWQETPWWRRTQYSPQQQSDTAYAYNTFLKRQ